MKRGTSCSSCFRTQHILRGVAVRYEESALHIGNPNRAQSFRLRSLESDQQS
jgi:hypothetical protein